MSKESIVDLLKHKLVVDPLIRLRERANARKARQLKKLAKAHK